MGKLQAGKGPNGHVTLLEADGIEADVELPAGVEVEFGGAKSGDWTCTVHWLRYHPTSADWVYLYTRTRGAALLSVEVVPSTRDLRLRRLSCAGPHSPNCGSDDNLTGDCVTRLRRSLYIPRPYPAACSISLVGRGIPCLNTGPLESPRLGLFLVRAVASKRSRRIGASLGRERHSGILGEQGVQGIFTGRPAILSTSGAK